MPAVVKSLIIVFIAQAYSSVYARQKLYFSPFAHHYDPRALCNDGSRGGNILEAAMIPRNIVAQALRFSYRLLLCKRQ